MSPFPLPPQTVMSDANLLQLITVANAAAAFIKIRGMPDYFHAQWKPWGRVAWPSAQTSPPQPLWKWGWECLEAGAAQSTDRWLRTEGQMDTQLL